MTQREDVLTALQVRIDQTAQLPQNFITQAGLKFSRDLYAKAQECPEAELANIAAFIDAVDTLGKQGRKKEDE